MSFPHYTRALLHNNYDDLIQEQLGSLRWVQQSTVSTDQAVMTGRWFFVGVTEMLLLQLHQSLPIAQSSKLGIYRLKELLDRCIKLGHKI